MDTVLIPSQATQVAHNDAASKDAYQEQLKAHVAAVDSARVVPPHTPVLTLEQRVAALEAKASAITDPPAAPEDPRIAVLQSQVASLEAVVKAMSTPAEPAPAA